MFGNLGNMANIVEQAQEMQKRMSDLQKRLEEMTVTGQAGGDSVAVIMSVKGVVKSVRVQQDFYQDNEQSVIEDLIVAACNDAKRKAEALSNQEMQAVMGDLQLPPGFQMPQF